MNNNSSLKNIDGSSSSEYFEACSNSEELNKLEMKRIENEKFQSKKDHEQSSVSIKEDSKSDYKSPQKKK